MWGLQLRALHPKANKAEKVKNSKGGDKMWTEISELGELIREGKTSWEDLGLDDIDVRLKWAGLFHRRKRTPGKFMMRLKVRCATHMRHSWLSILVALHKGGDPWERCVIGGPACLAERKSPDRKLRSHIQGAAAWSDACLLQCARCRMAS